MLIQDYALIYKKNNTLYYAISKKNGKIILKNNFSPLTGFDSHAFFFLYYDYLSSKYQSMKIKNDITLPTEDFMLDYINSCDSVYIFIPIFIFIFDYYIEYREPIDHFFEQLKKCFQKKNNKYECTAFLFDLLFYLQVFSEEETDNYLKEKDNILFFNKDRLTLIKHIFLKDHPFKGKYIERQFAKIIF